MNPNEEAKKANLDVRRETPPVQAEYLNKQQAEQGGGALQRERKALPNEQFPGQYEQGTAAAEGVDGPTNAGNALPEGMGKPINNPNPHEDNKDGKQQPAQPDEAARQQREAEQQEADAKLKSAQSSRSATEAGKTPTHQTNPAKR